MNIKAVLRDGWHLLLCYRDKKKQWIHGNQALLKRKEYGHLIRSCMVAGIELLYFDTEKQEFYLKTPSGIVAKTNKYYTIFLEIFSYKLYALPPVIQDKYTVFDIGMNRGYTALYFASDPDCENVFGFEIDEHTYRFASDNFKLNPSVSSKIHAYNYGWLDKEEEIEMYYLEGADGIASVYSSFVNSYWSEQRKEDKQVKKSKVLQASKIMNELLAKYETHKKILKIDCEGAEYVIFADLKQAGLLDQFDIIIGECHQGLEGLEIYLQNFVCMNQNNEGSGISQFCYVNKKYEQN